MTKLWNKRYVEVVLFSLLLTLSSEIYSHRRIKCDANKRTETQIIARYFICGKFSNGSVLAMKRGNSPVFGRIIYSCLPTNIQKISLHLHICLQADNFDVSACLKCVCRQVHVKTAYMHIDNIKANIGPCGA